MESHDIERRVETFLDGMGVDYEVVRIDPDFADTMNFCERYGYFFYSYGYKIVVDCLR